MVGIHKELGHKNSTPWCSGVGNSPPHGGDQQGHRNVLTPATVEGVGREDHITVRP